MGSRVELISQETRQSWVLQSKLSSSSLPWCQLVWERLVATMATMETTEDTSHHPTILTHPTTTHIPHHHTPTLRPTTPTPPTTTPTPPPTTHTPPTVAPLTATTTTTTVSSGNWSPSRRQLW